ncbi:hypothetical protein [Ahrensia sp. R2A130]|uniref:hypothetical protein n=1 Tax=Ahrensia sp. R2A130 TaxID=744979 RepID=UPI0001E083D0|nr:hypothetical protein [Ahrensia sp. R2A130]EFL89507.1 hypothetical protein R2A130_2116 [Ahrensia sp. R2A130]
MIKTNRPFLLDMLRELRQPLATLACLLVVVNLAMTTAAAAPGTAWSSLCIGTTAIAPDGDTKPTATTCKHCCLSVWSGLIPQTANGLTVAFGSAHILKAAKAFALHLRPATNLHGPRAPPALI